MKKHIALFALVAAALVAAPTVLRAEDKPAAPEAGQTAPHAKNGSPFHGKIAAIDTTASTVTIGSMTINVTSETKITKSGKPATLADFTVGEMASGFYKKDESGKLTATVLHTGEKGGKKPKKNENK